MTEWPPRVLSTIYKDGLQTLYDLLVDLIIHALPVSEGSGRLGKDDGPRHPSTHQHSHVSNGVSKLSRQLQATELRTEAEEILLKEGDEADYLNLLKSSYAAMSEMAPALGLVSFEQRWTQQQIVERVIALQFRQEVKPSHVLCSGYRKLRPSARGSNRQRAPQGLEYVSENSSVDIVNSHSWIILLSRVGDLIMLHLLSFAAIFVPLPNNCFLQISGLATSLSASISRKFGSLHPGEKMISCLGNRSWKSTSFAKQQKWRVRNSGPSGVKDEMKDQASHGADDHTFVDDFHQVFNEKSDCESDKVMGLNGRRSSDVTTFENSPRIEKGSKTPERFQKSSFKLSASLKRLRAETAESRPQTCVPEGLNKRGYVDVGKLVGKRRKCEPREKFCQDGGVLKPQIGNTLNYCSNLSLTNGLGGMDIDAKSPIASTQNHLSKRKSPKEPLLQHSIVDTEMFVNDDCGYPHSINCSRRPKLPQNSQKDTPCPQVNNLCTIADNVPSDSHTKVLGFPKCTKTTELKAKRSTGHERTAIKQGIVSQGYSNHGRSHGTMIQDASHSPQQDAGISLSRKRIRLPSWKRRKLRQVQQSCSSPLCKGDLLPLQSCGEGDCVKMSRKGVISQLHEAQEEEEELTNAGHKKSCGLESVLYQTGARDTGDSSCHPTSIKRTGRKMYRSSEAKNVAQQKTSVRDWRMSGASHSHFKSIHKLLKELLSNARRCGFARLLGRHCPLPKGFQSLHEDSTVVASSPLLQSQTLKTEQENSELGKARQDGEQQELVCTDNEPEIEEIMRLWLGSNYEAVQTATKGPIHSTDTVENKAPNLCEEAHKGKEFSSNGQNTFTCHVQKKTPKMSRHNHVEPSLGDDLKTEKTPQSELILCYTNHSDVVGFLWAVCRCIIPEEMLGSFRSWRALRSNIARFVSLRRHEKFNVQHALFKLQVSSFLWLDFQRSSKDSNMFTIEERELHQRRLELWLYWLFTYLVVPIIRAHFYVTENENHRQNVFYYRKPVWARIRSKGLEELTRRNYKKLSKQAVAQVLNERLLGFSQIRLLPKRTGLRPIANLAATSQGTLKFSIQTRRQATLCQVFADVAKELSSGGSSTTNQIILCHKKMPCQFDPSIHDNPGQDASVEPDEHQSTDAQKRAIPETSLVYGLSNRSTGAASCSVSAGKNSDPSCIVQGSLIQKRCKRRVHFSFRSINSVLRDAHCCLKLEKEDHPDDFGSSVFGYCDVHKKVLPFILQLKSTLNGMPRFFMAVCDVTRAYDTIQQEKLQNIIESFVQRSKYNVVRYACIAPALGSVRVSHERACLPVVRPHNFLDSVHKLAAKRSHCIFTDQAVSTSIRREQVLAMLLEHVKQNIVQIGAHFYQQTVGIPQGSILSSLLCSLFYGHFDLHSLIPHFQSHPSHSTGTFDLSLGLNSSVAAQKITRESAENDMNLVSSFARTTGSTECEIEHMLELSLVIPNRVGNQTFASMPEGLRSNTLHGQDDFTLSRTTKLCDAAGLSVKKSLLLRLIDDSLFISTSETAARVFVESMHGGSEEYGCHVNERKTAANFSLQLGNRALPMKVYKTEDGACFMPWSGLLINCYTLEFQADYTRYCGEHIRSTLTVKRERNQGWHLVLKLCEYMRPKCHVLFFDPRINSPATIRLNAFQAFLLCAMKFHAYVCCLPHVTGSNQSFLFKAIGCATRYTYGLLRHKMGTVGAETVFYFPYKELEWLALVAFCRVLRRKQSRYQVLLHMLQTKLQMQKYNKLRAFPHLLSAIDERRSSMFKLIKY